MRIAFALIPFVCLVLLCSCVSPPHQPPLIVESSDITAVELPHAVAMNKDAGRGNFLFVTLRLNDGEKLPFVLDTGAEGTVFDKSLEPKLGKRTGTNTLRVFGVRRGTDEYLSPALYLGKTRLMMTGPYVVTDDLSELSTNAARPIMGVLGMDVLGHYCIQLDFVANKIRFLDDHNADKNTWGQPFHLTSLGDNCFTVNQNLTGTKFADSLIDSGCNYQGWLVPHLFRQWTNQTAPLQAGEVHSPNAVLGSLAYTNVVLAGLETNLYSSGDSHLLHNGIGIDFLSRNLVTFDFLQKTMYLKQISIGPFIDEEMRKIARTEGHSALKFLQKLKDKGALPGWSKNDDGQDGRIDFHFNYPCTVTIDNAHKTGHRSLYHYTVTRDYKTGQWKLIKAWRTGQNGKVLEEYPLP
jgi:Aspartyl protease